MIDDETRAWAQPWKDRPMFQAEKELSVENLTGRWHALAEQIRKGCQIAPKQSFYILFRQIDGTPYYDTQLRSSELIYEACVEGAIMLGGGAFSTQLGDRPTNGPFDCPFCQNNPTLLVHLNNQHRMPREAIADWLDTL